MRAWLANVDGAVARQPASSTLVTGVAFLAYFAILLAVTLPEGLQTNIVFFNNSLTPLFNAQELIAVLGASDAGSYVSGGREMAKTGWVHTPGFLTLWPPGMFALHALGLSLVGEDGPLALVIIVLSLAAWACAFTLIFVIARRSLSLAVSALLPLTLLLFPFVRDYLLAGGLFYSESLSAALWAISLCLMLLAASRRSILLAILSGATLAAAAYVRTQVDIVAVVTSFVAAAALLVRWLVLSPKLAGTHPMLDEARVKLADDGTVRQTLVLLVVFATFHALTVPYRIHNYVKYDKFAWAAGYGYYYRYVWTPPEDYSQVAEFIRVGGGPIGCAVDQQSCRWLRTERRTSGEASIPLSLYEELTKSSMLRNPLSWISYRLAHLPTYWFSGPTASIPNRHDYISGGALIALGMSVFLFLALIPISCGGLLLATSWLGLGAATAATFMFVHYEVRYLYLFQFGSIVLALAGLSLWAQSVRKEWGRGSTKL